MPCAFEERDRPGAEIVREREPPIAVSIALKSVLSGGPHVLVFAGLFGVSRNSCKHCDRVPTWAAAGLANPTIRARASRRRFIIAAVPVSKAELTAALGFPRDRGPSCALPRYPRISANPRTSHSTTD